MEEKKKKRNILREIGGWIIYLILVMLAVNIVTTYIGQRTKVTGDSMLNTLHSGDNLIIDKLTYKFKEPERFDVVVFPYRYAKDTYYIKRVIGLPGETVQIKDGFVYINDEKLEESYGIEVIEKTKYGLAEEPIQLGEGEYFVLGDNRNDSSDSRDASVGILRKEEIIGKAWVRIWPLERAGAVS